MPAEQFGSLAKYKEKCLERWKIQKPTDIVIEAGANWWNFKHYPDNRKKLKKHLTNIYWPSNQDADETKSDEKSKRDTEEGLR